MNSRFAEIKKSVELSYKPTYIAKLKELNDLPDCSRKKTGSISARILWLAGDYDNAIRILNEAINEIKQGENQWAFIEQIHLVITISPSENIQQEKIITAAIVIILLKKATNIQELLELMMDILFQMPGIQNVMKTIYNT